MRFFTGLVLNISPLSPISQWKTTELTEEFFPLLLLFYSFQQEVFKRKTQKNETAKVATKLCLKCVCVREGDPWFSSSRDDFKSGGSASVTKGHDPLAPPPNPRPAYTHVNRHIQIQNSGKIKCSEMTAVWILSDSLTPLNKYTFEHV